MTKEMEDLEGFTEALFVKPEFWIKNAVKELSPSLQRYSLVPKAEITPTELNQSLEKANSSHAVAEVLGGAIILDDPNLAEDLKRASKEFKDIYTQEAVMATAVAVAKAEMAQELGVSSKVKTKLEKFKNDVLWFFRGDAPEPAQAKAARETYAAGRKKALQLTATFSLATAFLAACGPTGLAIAEAPQPDAIPITEVATPTETATPTEVPDAMVEASQNLPEGSGTIEKVGDQWIFDSPLEAEIGKNVPVQMLEHTYEDGTIENWIALEAHPEWPLFIQNEEGNWETALEYVAIKEPFVNQEGNPLPLTCKSHGIGQILADNAFLGCFLVANGSSFREGVVEFQPVAIPMDGKPESPMFTNGVLPLPDKFDKGVWEYPNRIFVPRESAVIPISHSFPGEYVTSKLEQGEVFWTLIRYDRANIEEFIEQARANGWPGFYTAEKVKEHRQEVSEVFTLLTQNKFGKIMQQRLELWDPWIFLLGR